MRLEAAAKEEVLEWETMNRGNLFERFCCKEHQLSTSDVIDWLRVILRERLSLSVYM